MVMLKISTLHLVKVIPLKHGRKRRRQLIDRSNDRSSKVFGARSAFPCERKTNPLTGMIRMKSKIHHSFRIYRAVRSSKLLEVLL